MKFNLNLEYLSILFIVIIIVLIVIGVIYSSAIKRNIFCAGPFVFLPTCDLSMLILPELNEPLGSICQSHKQCNGYRRGVKCCGGVCTMIGCATCEQFCRITSENHFPIDNPNTKFPYFVRNCGRREGQPCIFDEDCRGIGAPTDTGPAPPAPAAEKAVCCGGVCKKLNQLRVVNCIPTNNRSCAAFCRFNPGRCFNYQCRI